MQTHIKPVAIIGGVITELTAGLYLQRVGVPVTGYEAMGCVGERRHSRTI